MWEEVGYMSTSGNRSCQLAPKNALNDFTDGALTVSAGSLFQNGTSPSAESVLATVGTTSLLVEFIGVVA